MGILLWIIFGALAGWLTSVFMGTNARQGLLGNIILGIIGAFVGGLIANFLGISGITGFNIYSLLIAILGSVVVTAIVSSIG